MEGFDSLTNSEFNLIDEKINNTFKKIVNNASDIPQNLTISDKISNLVSQFYNSYVKNHLFTITLVFLLLLFLLFRNYRKNNKEQFSKYDLQQPIVNNLQPVKEQYYEKTNYPPSTIPINVNNDLIYDDIFNFNNEIHNGEYQQNDINHDDINTLSSTQHNYSPDNRDYYGYGNINKHGKNDKYYQNHYASFDDTQIPNPLGFSNMFNSTTNKYLNQMTNANTNNINLYDSLIRETNNDLESQLKIGPKHLPENGYKILPPYYD